MRNPLTQQVNFYVSIAFVAVFGFFTAITVGQALNKDAPLVAKFASPVVLSGYEEQC